MMKEKNKVENGWEKFLVPSFQLCFHLDLSTSATPVLVMFSCVNKSPGDLVKNPNFDVVGLARVFPTRSSQSHY